MSNPDHYTPKDNHMPHKKIPTTLYRPTTDDAHSGEGVPAVRYMTDLEWLATLEESVQVLTDRVKHLTEQVGFLRGGMKHARRIGIKDLCDLEEECSRLRMRWGLHPGASPADLRGMSDAEFAAYHHLTERYLRHAKAASARADAEHKRRFF